MRLAGTLECFDHALAVGSIAPNGSDKDIFVQAAALTGFTSGISKGDDVIVEHKQPRYGRRYPPY